MRVDWILEAARLRFLEDFLDHVERDAFAELEEIEQQAAAGELEDVSDIEVRNDYPLARLEIASRAVLYELTALVESRLQEMARVVFAVADHPPRKTASKEDDAIPTEQPPTAREVTDLPWGKVIALVESSCGITIESLDGWHEFIDVREAVNAFKHRGGYRRWSEIIERDSPLSYSNVVHEATTGRARDAHRVVSRLLASCRQLEIARRRTVH